MNPCFSLVFIICFEVPLNYSYFVRHMLNMYALYIYFSTDKTFNRFHTVCSEDLACLHQSSANPVGHIPNYVETTLPCVSPSRDDHLIAMDNEPEDSDPDKLIDSGEKRLIIDSIVSYATDIRRYVQLVIWDIY